MINCSPGKVLKKSREDTKNEYQKWKIGVISTRH